MTQLSAACIEILNQLKSIVTQLRAEDFVRPSATLSGSTVGQHLRHTLEFFLCLESGFESGTINYDKRRHDKQIETDKQLALAVIIRVRHFITSQQNDRTLNLEVGYDPDSDARHTILTNYFRELTYNIEHAIHHMAIIKIGVREVAPYITLVENFGVAVSTVRHRELAQA